MTGERLHGILHYLHRLTVPGAAGEGTDGQLLEQFVTQRDEAAFAALVRRHGPLVWGVCRRLLRRTQDAEDVFQATFLVLAHRAGSVGKRESVRSFLYGVAYRVAVRARGTALRRQAREVPLDDVAAPEADGPGPDLRPVLDEEIGRLPEKYRLPLILCHLEGRTQEEAARLLGCPRATVATRLTRGRDRLREQLARRGLDVSAGAFAALLRDGAAPPVPDALAEGTLRAVATEAASPRVMVLAGEVVRGMLLARWRTPAIVLLALGVVGSGAGVLASRPQAPAPSGETRAEEEVPAVAMPAKKPAEKGAAEGGVPNPPPPQAPQKALELADKLEKPVKFAGVEADDKFPLQEMLDNLADRYDLIFDVNEAAFRADGVKDVLAEQVAKRPLPKMMNVRLNTVLRKVLDRIPAASGATYLIRDNTIELTTEADVLARLGRHDRGPRLPLVYSVFDQHPLGEALVELAAHTEYTVVVDPRLGDRAKVPVTAKLPNVPLDTAVRVLADMGGLKPVRLDNVFYVTTPENADRLRAEHEREHPAPAEKKTAPVGPSKPK
jgi:RNA polymerase sigma factor (sigma-70 family)